MRAIGFGLGFRLCIVLLAADRYLQAEDTKAKLTLTSPITCQVFQRDKADRSDIRIEGTVSDKADVIEAKTDLATGAKRGDPVEWVAVTPPGKSIQGQFHGRLSLQAGGWYRVTVRARVGTRTVAEQTVDKVGVGEVFVTAGQSNSANFGNPRQKARDDRVVYFDGKRFVQAQDPIPGGCGGGGSPWAVLGDRIVASQQIPVCFRSASLNWTEVAAWLPPNTALYKNLSSCVKAFGKDGVRAVLWHQGESDTLVKTSAETYCDRVKTIVEALNKDAGYELPWLVAQASFHPGSQAPEQQQVAKGQRLLWTKRLCYQGPVTDDLLGPKYRHDGVHFNQQGLAKHAERWFDVLSTAFKWKSYSSDKPDRAATDQPWLNAYDVVWTSPSADARGSMPCGGGNIGLNVWVEKDELLVYIGSPDSWSYRGAGWNTQMQTKLGRLRVKLNPSPWAREFRQELDLASNSILLSGRTAEGDALKLRVWVDALRPVVHLEGAADRELDVRVAVEFPSGPAMAPHAPGQVYTKLVREGRVDGDAVEWWERSPAIDEGRAEYIRRFKLEELAEFIPNPMANRTMGGRLTGTGMVADGTGEGSHEKVAFRAVKLKSAAPIKQFDIRASLRIAQDTTLEQWQAQVKQLDAAKRGGSQADWKASMAWWREFWNRM